jgi:hypothetical protein
VERVTSEITVVTFTVEEIAQFLKGHAKMPDEARVYWIFEDTQSYQEKKVSGVEIRLCLKDGKPQLSG